MICELFSSGPAVGLTGQTVLCKHLPRHLILQGLAGSVLTGSATSALKKVSSGKIKLPSLEADDPRFGPGSPVSSSAGNPGNAKKTSISCLGCALPVVALVLLLGAVTFFTIFIR